MATISKICLSESTDGRGIVVDVASNATVGSQAAGQLIHTGPSNTADYHEVWLWATNFNTSTETLCIQWGDTAANQEGDWFYTTINPNETVLVVPGWIIKGNSTPLTVNAHSTTTNKVNIVGYVNFIDAA
tara:strand:+ start:1398 stop:1787 length:390 start_codon:yes stop_codon:yes gene_type:complete